MMFFARVFSMVEDVPSRNSICDELLEAGYDFATAPGKEDEEFKDSEWTYMDFQYDKELPLIHLMRNTKELDEDLFIEEIDEFQETIDELPYGRNTKRVKGLLAATKQIYAFQLEEEMDENGWSFLEVVLDYLCDSTDGYVQIDGEGIYDKEGKIMLEFE